MITNIHIENFKSIQSLDLELGRLNIFNVMASARPILAVTPPGSEIMQIVEEAGCGWNVPPQSPEKLADAIIQLKDSESAMIQMGKNGSACPDHTLQCKQEYRDQRFTQARL